MTSEPVQSPTAAHLPLEDFQPRACQLCYKRKVKCDRRKPCSNCVKYNAQCEFRIQQHPSRDRKRKEQPSSDELRTGVESSGGRPRRDEIPIHKSPGTVAVRSSTNSPVPGNVFSENTMDKRRHVDNGENAQGRFIAKDGKSIYLSRFVS